MAAGRYTEHLTHDNGGFAFLVRYDKNTFWVHQQGGVDEVEDIPDDAGPAKFTRWLKRFYNELVMTSPYVGVLVGRSSGDGLENGPYYAGNSMLFFLPDGRCVCVASNVTAFTPPEPILSFKSPVIGADVSYPYAVGEDNSYLFGEGCFVPHADLEYPRQCPYHVAYMNGDDEDMTYIDSHKIEGFQELVKRPAI
jgi:hypothetical protein